ncbi:hypothetical protein CF127_18080 [Aeromonas veronii]|nr:hypothetical protein CF127_18080 [Aeromonas veronii]
MTEADIDNEIDTAIEELPAESERKRKIYRTLNLAMHIDPGVLIQENEERTFASELFIRDAKKHSLSNRELILRGLNSSAFINYFFLIEDVLKTMYIDLANPKNKFIKGSETINVCLKNIISVMGISDSFEKELHERSKFFFDMKSLELLWDILNMIRNQIAHSNGYYDAKAKRSLHRRVEKLAKYFTDNDGCILSISMIIDAFDKYEMQVNNTNYLIVDDILENIIRSTSIFIMESLYVCNRKI